MNKPKVSVIVPVYNAEKYLKCCIDSLLNQTLKDIEIILVDDGSPDHCPAMCDGYAKQDQRVKVIHKKNEGQGYARNSALEIATGGYIAFVDSDDYIESDAYQKLYSIAMDTKVDGVYFSCQRFDDRGNTWKVTNTQKEMQYPTKEVIRGFILDMIANTPNAKNDRDILSSVWSVLYRHDIIKRYALKFKSERDYNGGEDLLFNLDYLMHSSNVITIPNAFYNWRTSLSSYSHTIKPDDIIKKYGIYQYILDILKTNNFGAEGYLRATRFFIGYSRSGIRQYIQSSLSKKEKINWLKEVMSYPVWRDIASLFPYKQLPMKYALYFYLLHKNYYHTLYYISKI